MVSAGFSHEKLNDTPDFSMDGTVSIILPCYNVAPYLDECLESLVRQTWEDLKSSVSTTAPRTIRRPYCADGLKRTPASG